MFAALIPLLGSALGLSTWMTLAIGFVATLAMQRDQTIDGNRTSDFRIMGSDVGKGIPIVRGRYKISGNVIWQAGFEEHVSKVKVQDGGLLGSDTYVNEYRYSNQIVVGLCKNELTGIKRIWMNGKIVASVNNKEYDDDLSDPSLLYDFDEETGASNNPDPEIVEIGGNPFMGKNFIIRSLINSQGYDKNFTFTFFLNNQQKKIKSYFMKKELGEENVPEYKDLSYVVFNFNDLENFGNRIPKIEFEVVDFNISPEIDIQYMEESFNNTFSEETKNNNLIEPLVNVLYTTSYDNIANRYSTGSGFETRAVGYEKYNIITNKNNLKSVLKTNLKYPLIVDGNLTLSLGELEFKYNETTGSLEYEKAYELYENIQRTNGLLTFVKGLLTVEGYLRITKGPPIMRGGQSFELLKTNRTGFKNYHSFNNIVNSGQFGTNDFGIYNTYTSTIDGNTIVGYRENNGTLIDNRFYNSRPPFGSPDINDVEVETKKGFLVSRHPEYSIYFGMTNHKIYNGTTGNIDVLDSFSHYEKNEMSGNLSEVKPFFKYSLTFDTSSNIFKTEMIDGTYPIKPIYSNGRIAYILTYKENKAQEEANFYIYRVNVIYRLVGYEDLDNEFQSRFTRIHTFKSTDFVSSVYTDAVSGLTESIKYYDLIIDGKKIASTQNNIESNGNSSQLIYDFDRQVLGVIDDLDNKKISFINIRNMLVEKEFNLADKIGSSVYTPIISMYYNSSVRGFTLKGIYYDESDIVNNNSLSGFNFFSSDISLSAGEEISGTVNLQDIVGDILVEAGYKENEFDISNLDEIDAVGYAYSNNDTPRSKIELLQAMFLFNLVEEDWKLVAKKRGLQNITEIPFEHLSYSNDKGYRVSTNISSDIELDTKVGISYASLNSGHRETIQYAEFPDEHRKEQIIQTPFTMLDDEAAQTADVWLTTEHREIEKYEFSLSIDYIFLNIGDMVSIDGKILRIVSNDVKEVSIDFVAVSDSAGSYFSDAKGVGIDRDLLDEIDFSYKQRVVVWNGSTLRSEEYDILRPCIYIASIPEDAGSNIASAVGLVAGSPDNESFDQDEQFSMSNTSGGFILEGYGGMEYGIDPGSIKVQFTNGYTPNSITEDILFSNRRRNLIAIVRDGEAEYIQFKDVQKVEGESNTYILSNMLRGRFNSKPKPVIEGSVFVLLDSFNYGVRDFNMSRIGTQTYTVFFRDIESLSENSVDDLIIQGTNIRPYGLVNLKYEIDGSTLRVLYNTVSKINRDWTGDSNDNDSQYLTFYIDWIDIEDNIVESTQTKNKLVEYNDFLVYNISKVNIKVRDDNNGLYSDTYTINI